MNKLIVSSLCLLLTCQMFAINNSTVYPAQVIDLSNWKLTLPIDEDQNGSPDEIKQTELNSFAHADYFHVNSSSDGVVFKAHAGGATTKNSGYPRSELREMTNNGLNLASWDSNDGLYHVMELNQKITHTPAEKQHVVVGQIHDASDDIFMLRLENSKLFLEFNGTDGPVMDANYQLGTSFTFKVEVHNDEMKFYYNGNLMATKNQNFSGAYFKAGMYTQSSCQGSKQVANESCDAYGEMELISLSTFHGSSLPTSSIERNTSKAEIKAIGKTIVIENCNYSGFAELYIFDLQGNKIFTRDIHLGATSSKIGLENELASGAYITVLKYNNKKESFKLVIQ